jgi:hypothetical protein
VKRRVCLVVVAVLGSLLIAIPDAKACSCMPSDPRDQLHAADGAFSGTYMGREPTDITDPYAEWDYIFETDTVYKGDIGETIEVRAPANGAGCGLEYAEGSAAALFATEEEGVWHSQLCQTIWPELLADAAAPFPAPDAEGPPVLLVGGSFGEVRVIALDAQGRTAGYGYGEGDALLMSLCPGGERSIEMVGGYSTEENRSVDVRRISDLSVEDTTGAPASWRDEYVFPLDAACISPEAETVVFARGFANDQRYTELRRFAGGSTELIQRGRASEAALGSKRAFLAQGKKIVAVDLAGGEKSLFRRFTRRITHLTLTPDGRRLAAISGAASEDGKLVVMRTSDGKVTARRTLDMEARYGSLEWAGDEALLLSGLAQRSPIYSRSLKVKALIKDWFPVSSVIDGCKLFGVGYGALATGSACADGTFEMKREFFSPVTYSLLRLPDGTEVNAPPAEGS